MKPKTKLQKEVDMLSEQLPKLTLKQIIQLRQVLVEDNNLAYYNKGRVICTVCGHKFNIDHKGQLMTCPCCGTRLRVEESRKTSLKESVIEYVAFSRVFKGWQVTGVYTVEKTLRSGARTNYDIRLIQETWDCERGRVFYQSTKVMGYAYCREGKGWSYNIGMRAGTKAETIPCRHHVIESVLPALRKRGFNNENLKHFYIVPFINALLTNNEFESMLKRGQLAVSYLMIGGLIDDEMLSSIKIYLRHRPDGFKTSNHLRDWMDLIRCLKCLNKDIKNPKFICPEDFRKTHDYWMKKKADKEELERRQAQLRCDMERLKRDKELAELYIAQRKKFFDMLIRDDDIQIHVLKDINEFMEEGNAMHHCVFAMGYYNLKRKPNCLILSARSAMDGGRLETIEVDMETYKIIQSRGVHNSQSEYHQQIVSLMQKNMNTIRKLNNQTA